MSEPIIILGASARAAAQSAVRAGFSPWAVDLFADADLARICPVQRIERYPCDLFAAARLAPPGPWIYTGGLENYPRLVERITAERPLYGNPGAVLRRVRDPSQLAEVVRRAGLQFPQMVPTAAGLPRNGSWLRKSLRSSGGLRVEAWDTDNPATNETRGWYFQQRVAGDSHAAVFVADGQSSRLLGVTRQFVGGDGQLGSITAAPPFHYAGSVGPVSLPATFLGKLKSLGNLLAAEFQLLGLFGIDFIFNGEQVWPIEINPRFPASVEVLERASGFSGIGLHVAACRDRVCSDPLIIGAPERICGKAILYAREALSLDTGSCAALFALEASGDRPCLADIPAVIGSFAKGEPIVTLLADGPNLDAVTKSLEARLGELQGQLDALAIRSSLNPQPHRP